MSILYLPIKKKWFNMIASGEKKEEYREISEHWMSRIEKGDKDVVCLHNGYGKNSPKMYFKIKNIISGLGEPEWGAPTEKYVYIIQLGEKIPNPKK